ncbi:MAG: cytochrome c biogenesis protein ResB [Coriobacteriia bacterium]|nr:cytochrome c biogenesis protein ResB [Coriobacteriia bacterium]
MNADDRQSAGDQDVKLSASKSLTRAKTLSRTMWALLSSTRTATVLIAALTVLSVLGMIYPQDRIMTAEQTRDWQAAVGPLAQAGEAIGLNNLFTTWYFIALLLLLTANIIACTSRRLSRRALRSRALTVPAGVSGSLPTVSWTVAAEKPPTVASSVVATLSRVPWGVQLAPSSYHLFRNLGGTVMPMSGPQ